LARAAASHTNPCRLASPRYALEPTNAILKSSETQPQAPQLSKSETQALIKRLNEGPVAVSLSEELKIIRRLKMTESVRLVWGHTQQ
jgi:hypothetical protein